MSSAEPTPAPGVPVTPDTPDSARTDAAGQALTALIARMREAEIPPSVEEMADALWLARWLPAPDPSGTPERTPEERTPSTRATDTNGRGYRPLALSSTSSQEDRSRPDNAQLFVRGPGADSAVELRQVQVPAAPALPEPLALQRGLRILQRYRAPVRPVSGQALDEDRTADRAAESGLVQPVLRAVRRREARLLLVMDVSTSTVVWQQALDELRQVCERAGAFREVQVQYLHATDDGLPGYAAAAERTGPLHAPEQLSDPTGRRLTLVLSDCAGPMWRSGRMQRLLYRWASTAPVAVVQPLPQRMWLRTHLPARRGQLHRCEGPAGRLVFTPERGRLERGALPVPVLALRRPSVEGWARLVAGSTGQSLTAAAGWVHAAHAPASSPVRAAEELSGEDRVRAFVRQASPDARSLACYLSAVPLFLPVMQLVQHAMLAGTGPDVLSEVLLGGLLKRREDAADPRAVRYDFLPGVAAELRKRLTADEAKLLLKHCSEYIERHFGRTARNFPALAAAFLRGAVDPDAADADPTEHPGAGAGAGPEEHAGLRAFAEVSSDLLRDLGRRTPWPLPRPPDPRLGAVELLNRGRIALRRYEVEGLIRELDDAVALFKQAGAVAVLPAERGSAAEELANALLARWRVRRVGDDLREALAVLAAEHVTSVRGSLLRGTVHWLLAGELHSSWLGVDDLPDEVRRRARERADREHPAALWAFCDLLTRADAELTRVVSGDAALSSQAARAGTSVRPPGSQADADRSYPAGPAQGGPGASQTPPTLSLPPSSTGSHRSPVPAGPSAEDADRRRLAAETLPAVRSALADAGAPLAGPQGPLRAAGPEDWYLTHMRGAAEAAAVRLEYPEPERGHLVRGRIMLDLARQYLGRGPIEREEGPDEAAAADAGRSAGEHLMAALGTADALPAPERCRAWLDMASAIETFRTTGEDGGRDEERPRIMDAVEQALAAAGDDEELRFECHVLAARLHRDRFESTGRIADLDRAVTAWREGTALLAMDDPRRPGTLTEYGATLVRRGEQRDAAGDIDQAVRLLRAAVDWTSEDHPELADRRRTLGIAHYLRFRSQEVLADLYEADWILGEAARGAEDPDLAQDCWLQRGAVTMELADRVGNPALLQRADDHLRHAVEYAQETGDGDRVARARQLRGMLLERQGAPDRALRQYRNALADTVEPGLAQELGEAVARLASEVDRA
ncbi:hypothetical protein GCM10018793_40150 [Streptomyces sulfonofaciens]|uniref:Tetratricopeptide repeat protein n=1 Tax=Streptomyces sulfonofaciens TaxID=68272 RepID=A0A919GC82_9ACTN|nr:SAV_2336 N-terminal domain-related protein [Streptomyces sulfonofaciens]GHH81831.1 hypothetical protein GCM10018793_40150 [Streptomyces sulfonofaciens]